MMHVSKKSTRLPYYIAILLFGFLSVIAQVLFLREFLVVAYGNELYIGVIFTCWFMGITIGALIATRFADKIREPLRCVVPLLILHAIIATLNCVLIRAIRLIFSIPAGEIFPFGKFFLAASVTIIPFTMLTGIIFPLLCRISYGQKSPDSGRGIGTVYWIDSLGSIIGGAGFTFIMVKYFSSFELLSAVTLLITINALFLISTTRYAFAGKKVFICITLLLIGILGVFYWGSISTAVETWSVHKRWESLAPNIPLIDSIDTRYQNIAISQQAGQYNVAADGKFIAVFPDEYGTPPEVNLVFCQPRRRPKNVLIIGSGNPEIIHYALMHNPERLDYVELDGALIPLLKRYVRSEVRRSLADPKVHIHYVDGRRFVKFIAPAMEYNYDLIWVNVPDPSTVALNRFYTLEFFTESARILKPEGVFTIQVTSAVNYFGDVVMNNLGSIVKTLSEIFPRVVVTPGTRAFVFATMASENVVTTEPDILIDRYKRRGLTTPNFSPLIFYTMLEESQRELVKKSVEAALPHLPVNTDLHPLSYLYNLALWTQFSGVQAQGLFDISRNLKFNWLIVGALVILALRFAYLRFRKPPPEKILHFNGLFILGVTGFVGMASEILILLLFQSTFGYLYQRVGLIVAAFMLGLVIGGFVITRLLPTRLQKSLSILLGIELLFLTLILGCFYGVPVLSSTSALHPSLREGLFYLLTVLFGILGGVEFPLVGHVLVQSRYRPGYSAAIIDSLDHGGAAIGAFTTGIILIPALGIAHCFLALALLKGVVLLLFAFSRRIRQ